MRRLKWIGWFFGGGIVAYLLTYGVVYWFQDELVFQGVPLRPDYQFQFNQPFEEYFIPVTDRDSIHAILFRTDSTAKGLIVYFHGNADNLQRWGEYAIDFTSIGYDVLMTDYRGYGKSSGVPGEEEFYQDSETVLRWAQENIPHFKLVIYGRSLGTAVACHLATKSRPALVILETPFDELRSALYGFPSRYRFYNRDLLPNIATQVVILHGTRDLVVPLNSARKLKPLLKPGDLFVIVEGAGHGKLREFDLYHSTLASVL